MEGKTSSTLGKRLFKLKVKAKDGDMNYKTAFIRNLSKILWVATHCRCNTWLYICEIQMTEFLDKVSGTYVVSVDDKVKKLLN